MQDTASPLQAPELRQDRLRARLEAGADLVAGQLAREFGVSLDTIRRDLIGLEAAGIARRVRGGARPVAPPAAALRERAAGPSPPEAIARRAAAALAGARTILADGGLTVLAAARLLRPRPGLLVITPSPQVAAATHGNGIETVVLGGRLSDRGGIAVGPGTESAVAACAADVALLGACGLDAGYGLGSDDLLESGVKAAMAAAASRTLVVAAAAKLGRRARHRTLPPEAIGSLVTDAGAGLTAPFRALGIDVLRA